MPHPWRAALLYLAVLAGAAALVVRRPAPWVPRLPTGAAVATMAPVYRPTPPPAPAPAWAVLRVPPSALRRAAAIWAHAAALAVCGEDARAAAFLRSQAR